MGKLIDLAATYEELEKQHQDLTRRLLEAAKELREGVPLPSNESVSGHPNSNREPPVVTARPTPDTDSNSDGATQTVLAQPGSGKSEAGEGEDDEEPPPVLADGKSRRKRPRKGKALPKKKPSPPSGKKKMGWRDVVINVMGEAGQPIQIPDIVSRVTALIRQKKFATKSADPKSIAANVNQTVSQLRKVDVVDRSKVQGEKAQYFLKNTENAPAE